MKSNVNSQALIRQVVAHVPCPVCEHRFGMSDVQVVGQREQAWAIRLRCRECRAQSLVFAVVSANGFQPIYTDLSPTEWERFRQAAPISVNDVIEVHRFIQAYDGDFSELLDEPLPPE